MTQAVKKWYKVKNSPSITTATCSLQDGNLSVSSTVKTFVGHVKEGIEQAEAQATRMMNDLKNAVGEQE